jgi:hypothetical protein
VRDGQPSPHRPRLVVSRSTCPPLSPSLHANSFIKGTAVINTHISFLFPMSLPSMDEEAGKDEHEKMRRDVEALRFAVE